MVVLGFLSLLSKHKFDKNDFQPYGIYKKVGCYSKSEKDLMKNSTYGLQ